jgi:hypothetical protein
MSEQRYPCPCCGHLVFEEPPGSEDICLVCFWEDDLNQLRWPALAGGANAVSLLEAQKNFRDAGAIEARFAGDVRPPTEAEPRDPELRPIDETDVFETPGRERALAGGSHGAVLLAENVLAQGGELKSEAFVWACRIRGRYTRRQL